jgi:hypothetical protein
LLTFVHEAGAGSAGEAGYSGIRCGVDSDSLELFSHGIGQTGDGEVGGVLELSGLLSYEGWVEVC